MEMATTMKVSPFSYVPQSPNRTSFNFATDFYSAPNRTSFNFASDFYSAPTSPTDGYMTCQQTLSDSEDDDFEFETSSNSALQKKEPQPNEDLSAMAFADELFFDGKVIPLKLPPRFHYLSNQSSCVSSPLSPSSVLKDSFRRWSFSRSNNGDDFDPFMVALELVRNEVRGREQNTPHRRSRSFSPIRTNLLWPNPNESVAKTQKVEQTVPIKTKLPVPNTISKGSLKRDGSSGKGSKRFSDVKRVLLRRSESERTGCNDKTLPQTEPVKEAVSFRATQKTHNDKQRQLAMKRTRIPYKAPCMLVCLGFGHNGLRDLN